MNTKYVTVVMNKYVCDLLLGWNTNKKYFW